MTFETVETSKQFGRPFELYRFQYGPDAADCYKYTNRVKGFQDFLPIPISRDGISTHGKSESKNLNVRLPKSTDLAKLFLPYPTTMPVEVTIWQCHEEDPDEQALVVWVGRTLSNAYQGNEIILTCESTLISLKRQGLRRHWQIGCPYLLYGPQCKANRSEFTVRAEVMSIVDNVPQFEAGWNGPFPIEKFRGGMVYWQSDLGNEYRTIRAVGPSFIRFNGPVRGIEVGMEVEMILGCNHQRSTDCVSVFHNGPNYGGQPWIPLQNPSKHANFW